MKKFIANLTALATVASMASSLGAVSAIAENSTNSSDGTYVLMNIPYDEFYKADIVNYTAVDGVASATLQKTRGSQVTGSFHVDPNGSEITGVTYPVKVSDLSKLSRYKQVTDSDSVTITTSGKGGTTTDTVYSGKNALFESDKYSYYVLSADETPANYKEVSFDSNGEPVFSEIKGKAAQTLTDVEVATPAKSKYGDHQVNLSGVPFDDDVVYGVILKTEDGKSYGLRHLENIWRKSQLAWCTGTTTSVKNSPTSSEHYIDMLGHTITDIEYITSSGVYNIPTDVKISGNEAYVLMNIPYDEFYKSEVSNDTPVDVVTSATLNKTRTYTLVGGSFHVDPNGTDITGITYPVKVADLNKLRNFKKVTDDDSVTISVTNRGKTSESVYTGKDALFENEKYAYYVLSEDSVPENYKEFDFDINGKASFSAVEGKASETLNNVEAEITNKSKYGDYQIGLGDLPFSDSTIYGVVLNTEDGKSYGLRHLENVWRVKELAWSTGITTAVHGSPTSSEHYLSTVGHTITNIKYITSTGVYNIPTRLLVKAPVTTEALSDAIAKAETLNENTYTADSWKAVKTALEAAKAELEKADSQEAVDKAAADLETAVKSLITKIANVTGFKASSTTATSVKLVWNKVADAKGYIVYKYDTAKKTWVRAAAPSANSYIVSKLSGATSYKFAVKAYKTVNGKEITSVSYPTVTAVTNPAVVSGFKVSSTSASAVKLTWSKVSGANGYVVYKYDTAKKTWVRAAKITSNTYTASKLKAGTSYKFAVKAYKTVNGKEVLSTSFPQLTASTNPATANFTLTAGSKKATVKWNKVTGASGYIVYYKTSKNGKWVKLTTAKASATSYTKNGLTKGKTYYFTVKAYRTVNGKTYNAGFTTKSVKVK